MSNTVTGKKLIQMESFTKENLSRELKTATEKFTGLLETNMKENLSKIGSKEKVKLQITPTLNFLGTFTWHDQRKYVGDFKRGKMHGKGFYTWPDGKKYQGEYQKGKKEGWGVYTWKNGKEYAGTWKEGKQDGYGYIRIHQKCEAKKGVWKEGKFVMWIEVEDESTNDEMSKHI